MNKRIVKEETKKSVVEPVEAMVSIKRSRLKYLKNRRDIYHERKGKVKKEEETKKLIKRRRRLVVRIRLNGEYEDKELDYRRNRRLTDEYI